MTDAKYFLAVFEENPVHTVAIVYHARTVKMTDWSGPHAYQLAESRLFRRNGFRRDLRFTNAVELRDYFETRGWKLHTRTPKP